jgi:hypothetical protein
MALTMDGQGVGGLVELEPERAAHVQHVVVGGVALAELAHRAGKVLDRAVRFTGCAAQACRDAEGAHRSPSTIGLAAAWIGAGASPVPLATLVTDTAPALKRGCLETGSQLVSVSSFAARSWLPGFAASQ